MSGTRRMQAVALAAMVLFFAPAMAVRAAGEYGSEASSSGAAAVKQEQAEAARDGRVLVAAIQEAQKRWRNVKAEQAEDAAHDFLVIYRELESATQIPAAAQAKLLKTVRSKLSALSRLIAKNVKKEQHAAAKLAGKSRPESVTLPENQPEVAAQRMAGGRSWNNGNVNRDDYDRLGRIGGEQLVEVIKKTISPASWDDNGGNGTIIYWGTQRYLIITQTDEVHEQIGGLMGQLRR